MTRARIDAALRLAAAGRGGTVAAPRRLRIRQTVAVGDPQAPFATFLGILDHHGALDDDGMVRPEVGLISMGDHFDWGDPGDRVAAAADGELLLTWLALHPPEQVCILIGNHDLARVGELWDLSDHEFATALRAADDVREHGASEDAFKRAWPRFFSAEQVARDLSTFRASQRALVEALLRARRFKAACALEGALFVHAGVTRYELAQLGLREDATAEAIAAALDAALDAACAQLGQAPLSLGQLHVPGTGAYEGRGMFYHRPTLDAGRLTGERPWRRFDPRELPPGLTQVVGHVRDAKCVSELQRWSAVPAARDGPVRHLIVEGDRGRYAHGAPPATGRHAAVMVFVDNGMGKIAHPAEYRLLDAGRRTVAEPLV
ncbi:MAG: metallophosphoesterase [Deltaproteobacteria bacterium]|nr:metallophosphoesterase [Deltaproteobacteria bacterium]